MATTSAVGKTGPTDVSNLSPAVQQALKGITIKSNKSTLTQDDFLKLLTTQLQNQDPLKPMEDAQFMGTMAQFASLEQTKELNATMAGLSSSLGMSSAQQFLGMNVVINNSGTNVAGLVTGITMVNGAPQVTVNGNNYATNTITSITLPTAGTTTSK